MDMRLSVLMSFGGDEYVAGLANCLEGVKTVVFGEVTLRIGEEGIFCCKSVCHPNL